ncbi:recombinase family protein [Burkholderia cepacia]|uniref:recombinase family protein n=1 Tax=Burkholderia cepacia TaxID=292 RepID=UPI00158C409A|nr:recombinase family protein [Burkholderia cepacia]
MKSKTNADTISITELPHSPPRSSLTQRSTRAAPDRTGRKIGYARVSTEDQSLELQLQALREAGCDQLFTDHGTSGANFSRPGLDLAMSTLKAGDTLIVWRLDRLGRSLGKLVDLVQHLGNRRIQFTSLNEAINTQSPGGTLVFHLMAAMAEFERSLISERTRAGLAARRAQGVPLGRKPALSPTQRLEAIKQMQTRPISDVAAQFNVHPRTLARLHRSCARDDDPLD